MRRQLELTTNKSPRQDPAFHTPKLDTALTDFKPCHRPRRAIFKGAFRRIPQLFFGLGNIRPCARYVPDSRRTLFHIKTLASFLLNQCLDIGQCRSLPVSYIKNVSSEYFLRSHCKDVGKRYIVYVAEVPRLRAVSFKKRFFALGEINRLKPCGDYRSIRRVAVLPGAEDRKIAQAYRIKTIEVAEDTAKPLCGIFLQSIGRSRVGSIFRLSYRHAFCVAVY